MLSYYSFQSSEIIIPRWTVMLLGGSRSFMFKFFDNTVEPCSMSLIHYQAELVLRFTHITKQFFCIKINMKINNPFHPQNVCFYVYFLNRKGAIRKNHTVLVI